MIGPLVGVELFLAFFVGYNIGGSTTAPAFGPAIGADLVPKWLAGVLMAVCFALGAGTIGRRVVDTLGSGLLAETGLFSVEASVIVLGFVGGTLYLGNRVGVPASTSMTTVGAIAGLGVASGALDSGTMAYIVLWWVAAPLIGFVVTVLVGATVYPRIDAWIDAFDASGPLVDVRLRGHRPVVDLAAKGRDELLAGGIILLAGCTMAFSSGASNIANAVAPLVGGGLVGMNPAIAFGSAAVALGALSIARRTLETLGNEITDLPLPAALVVSTVSAGLVIALSAIGVPASFVVIATVCIAGLGWSRQRFDGAGDGNGGAASSPDPTDGEGSTSPGRPVVDGGPDVGSAGDEGGLAFDLRESARVLALQHVIPAVATVGSYLAFTFYQPF